jgi:hypothetical protein
MDIKKFKEWKELEDYKKLNVNSNVILYKNHFRGVDNDWEWDIWGGRDIPDEWLKQNQKEYPELEIKRMNVQEILKQDSPKYSYVKKWCSDELEK